MLQWPSQSFKTSEKKFVHYNITPYRSNRNINIPRLYPGHLNRYIPGWGGVWLHPWLCDVSEGINCIVLFLKFWILLFLIVEKSNIWETVEIQRGYSTVDFYNSISHFCHLWCGKGHFITIMTLKKGNLDIIFGPCMGWDFEQPKLHQKLTCIYKDLGINKSLCLKLRSRQLVFPFYYLSHWRKIEI